MEKKKWFDNAQEAVRKLWEMEYKGKYPTQQLAPQAQKERSPDPAFDR